MRALAILCMTAATAAAEPPKYKRAPVHIDAPLSDRVTPKRVVPRAARPSVSADDLLAAEIAAEPIRQDQEQLLRQLVHDTPDDSPDKPDLMFRLAELYAMQARIAQLQALALHR